MLDTNPITHKPELWTDTFLDQQRQIGDPEADDVIETLLTEQGQPAARELFDRLIREIEIPVADLPPQLQTFVGRHRELVGIEEQQISAAQDLFEDHGPKFLMFLYFKSLPLVYSCVGVAKVLAETGRLTRKQNDLQIFARRIAETGQFLIDVMSKGGLQAGAIGIQSILKVRLIHAAIRVFVREQWDSPAHGKPINQEDMAMTLLTFCLSLIEGLQQFEIDEPEERKANYFATWRAIGSLLGLNEAMLPDNLLQARTLMDRILRRQSITSSEGRLLTGALVDFINQSLKSERFKNLPQALIRFFVGDQMAASLGLLKSPNWLNLIIIFLMRLFLNYIERLEDAHEPIPSSTVEHHKSLRNNKIE